ncbi:hypothetical protein BIWAKO_05789 [Bosea sp. BIWAKO-01]|nr:hypothetical protein BIWAKO_05789 [Bosea sp. BIWAKO-01]
MFRRGSAMTFHGVQAIAWKAYRLWKGAPISIEQARPD